jgi:hypothetical protein
MSTKIDLLIKFKNTLVSFIDEIIEQFPQDSDLIICRIYIKDQIPTENLINMFIKYFLPQKQLVANKDEEFFLNGTKEFFEDLKIKSNVFQKVWLSNNVLDDDDRDIIWEWISSIITIVDKYNNLENK